MIGGVDPMIKKERTVDEMCDNVSFSHKNA